MARLQPLAVFEGAIRLMPSVFDPYMDDAPKKTTMILPGECFAKILALQTSFPIFT
jgi:hypothetical protein